MPLQGTSNDLADSIMEILSNNSGPNHAKISVDQSDSEGNPFKSNVALAGNTDIVSYRTLPNPLGYSEGVSGRGSGVEAMASVISDKVLEHIITNFELASQARLDTLEDDYNKFLAGMIAVSSGLSIFPLTAGAGAALIAATMSGGTPARTAITTALRVAEKGRSKGSEIL
jgi:hypothetical protein